ncbi:MAG: CPBP family glutamic-type intramembrane protease [Gammaproteobacteria bacterium]
MLDTISLSITILSMQLINDSLSRFINSVPLLLGLACLCYFCEVQAPVIYKNYVGVYNPREPHILAYFCFYTLLCFWALPALANKLVYKESLKDLGFVFPEKKLRAVFLIFIGLAILLPYIIFFAYQTEFKSYSLGTPSVPKFIFMVGVLFPIHYVGEEFFFRGFLFLGLWKRVGWHSFWITDIIFTLSHIGKPIPEVLLCIPASVVFNFINLF